MSLDSIAVVDYFKSQLPLADPLLQHVEVADVTSQAEASVQSPRFSFSDSYACCPVAVM